MLPPSPIRTLFPVALTMLLATLLACGGAAVSAGPEGTDAVDGAAPSAEGSTSDSGNVVLVVGDGGTTQATDAADAGPATGIDATAVDAGAVGTVDSSAATAADAAPDEGADASLEAAADVFVVEASLPEAAPVPDAAVVEAGPVCTATQLLCAGACVTIDADNCGTCGHACTGQTPTCGVTGGAYACTSGCAAGQTRCGSVCVDTTSDGDNCGACGQACGDGETCQASHCACPAGETLCGSACTPTATDDANCGACGHACVGGETCHAGSCVCPAGETYCGSACTSESTDDANCGACGHACVGGETCASGVCACPSGQAFCGSACTSESSDGNNCGACGHVCTGGETCQSGACACPSGETLCGATCVAEATDANNCGACGHGCLGGACSAGSCQPVILATPGESVPAIATDGTYVYWAHAGSPYSSIARCEIASCLATTTNLVGGIPTVVDTIAFDPAAGRVLFGGGTGLWSTTVTTTQSIPTPWGPSVGTIGAILVAPPVYFWSNSPSGLSTSNGAGTYFGTAIAQSNDSISGIAADDTNVYAADSANDRLLSCPLHSLCGSSPTVVASSIPAPTGLFYDGATLWMTSAGTSANSYADGAIYACTPTSCSVFAGAQAYPIGIVSDGTNVYWTNISGESVMRSPTGHAAPVKVASDTSPMGLAQTSTAIMWGDNEGNVTLLAK